MSAVVLPKAEPSTAKIIEVALIEGKLAKKPEVRYNKDGSIDKRHPNKAAGTSSEVYPFNTEEEIKAMINVFNKRIDEAPDDDKRWIACRNKMLFLIGINVGLRASDLCGLKYSFFMNEDGSFKDSYSLQPKKTRRTGKFVKLYFNETVKKAITNYLEDYPMEDLDDYLFKSREGDGYIEPKSLWRIIVDTAKEAGLKNNYGTHSLRKTFGRFVYHNAKDKNNALVILQVIFNHNSPATTSKYIGLTDDEVSVVFNELNLGGEFV